MRIRNKKELLAAQKSGRSLVKADMTHTDLRDATLAGADLSGTDLTGADLTGADLRGAILRDADLRNARLHYADLDGVKGTPAHWPSSETMLLVDWGEVSPELCRDLMNYDASLHPDPARFDEWARGSGRCPYINVRVTRAAGFVENPDRWDPSVPLCSAKNLVERLIKEKMGAL